jgi:hypothetical protein
MVVADYTRGLDGALDAPTAFFIFKRDLQGAD